MGANNSTRKITLVNDEKAGVIKLSESLAQRLRGQLEREKSEAKPLERETVSQRVPIQPSVVKSPDAPSHYPPDSLVPPVERLPKKEVPEEASHGISHERDVRTSAGATEPPWSAYAQTHLLVSQLREEKDMELKRKDEEWREKLKQKEKEYTDMAKLTQEHMNETVNEIESLFMKVSCTPVCQDQQENVLKCYQKHQSQSLRCSDEVERFARCVDLSRLQSFMKERVS